MTLVEYFLNGAIMDLSTLVAIGSVVGVTISRLLPPLLIMGFRPLSRSRVLNAIGRTDDLPLTVRRALEPNDEFHSMPVPRPGDWLAEHYEAGQTFDEFIMTVKNRPDASRNFICIQPLGYFMQDRAPALETLESCTSAYFTLPVRVLPPVDIRGRYFTSRINPLTRHRQMLTLDILVFLIDQLPPDAFCILGVTMEDLYPDPAWNYVFGQASLRDRAGVFSLARYDPLFYGEKRAPDAEELLLRRSCKVLIHEIAHMFSLEHCIFFRCILNGSNHLQESDSRPPFFCPVCLRKLQFSIGFDIVDRYINILRFYNRIGFHDAVRWVSDRLQRITGNEYK